MNTTPTTPTNGTPRPKRAAHYSKEEFMELLDLAIAEQMADRAVGVDEMAALFYKSPSQFSRAVKRYTGMAAATYIRTFRINTAKDLLLSYPRYSITEVALKCGFADNPHFTHAFQHAVGMTPSEYIRRYVNIQWKPQAGRRPQE